MNSALAFAYGQSTRNQPVMVFDWDRAAERIKETNPTRASAGLQGDWGWTGGRIWADGKPVPHGQTYTYLASTWATPELELDGEREECFRLIDASPDWDQDTYWPLSALAILGATLEEDDTDA